MAKNRMYICKRDERDWEGALIICAKSEYEAMELYCKYEQSTHKPWSIKEVPFTIGVLYEDYTR
jgi:hypothetical protein